MIKNDIFQNSHILLYKSTKDWGAKAPPGPQFHPHCCQGGQKQILDGSASVINEKLYFPKYTNFIQLNTKFGCAKAPPALYVCPPWQNMCGICLGRL